MVAGAALLIFANIFRDKGPKSVVNNPQTTVEATNSPQPQNSLIPNAKLDTQASLSRATCQLSGSIRFIDENLYETIGAKIAYQNVDDKIRQIFWKSNPDDKILAVGPNLFEDLEIPSGETEIGVVLEGEPTVENYTLFASITYGVKRSSGAVDVKIVDCSGKITVDVSSI